MRHLMRYISQSTLKREAASLIMIWYLGMGSWLMVTSTAAMAKEMWESLMLLVFALFGGAFGLDWISKQTTIAGPPSAGEATVTTEQTDTGTNVTATTEPKP